MFSCVALVALAGCVGLRQESTPPPASPYAAQLARARELYEQRRYSEAVMECNDVARLDPLTPGLAEIRKKVVNALLKEREREAKLRSEPSLRALAVDVERQKHVPETFGLRRGVRGETEPLRAKPTSMEGVLESPVSLYFTNLPLAAFVIEVGRAANVNMVVDPSIADSSISINVKNAPLSEILDYVSRNLKVAFYAGKNIIWVTPQTGQADTIPMETRMYRLRKGVSSMTADGVDEGNINILKAIEKFIPAGAGGGAVFYDKSTHILMAKNTRVNLRLIEDIIETLDVSPPQILIEARFISTDITDLRELGVDWKVSASTIATKKVLRDGSVMEVPASILRTEEKLDDFTQKGSGLNLTYQGLLTQPTFEALLHALESSGRTRTLSVPRITTVNNSTANIHVGETFPYWTQFTPVSVVSGYDNNRNPIYSEVMSPSGAPTEKQLGIELSVTPTVGADLNSIGLVLKPQISALSGWVEQMVSSAAGVGNNNIGGATNTNSLAVVKLPIFREQKMETRAVVQSGETVVLGGLITTTDTKKVDRIPILGRIPLIGFLFRHESDEAKSQNLLVFVTATIISERGEDLVPIK